MNPVTQTSLLLVVVLAAATVSAMSWYQPWNLAFTVIPALVAGMACGRITRLVRRLSE